MQQLTFVTGNSHKFNSANTICKPYGIQFMQQEIQIDEIQASDGVSIAKDKAQKVYTQLHKPLVVTDDSWNIPGLRGFPGPYMHYVNDCLTAEDWLRLTQPLTDRHIVLHQVIVYQDQHIQQVFSGEITGTILREARGKSAYAHFELITFDGHLTAAEAADKNGSSVAHLQTAWHKFAEWYENYS